MRANRGGRRVAPGRDLRLMIEQVTATLGDAAQGQFDIRVESAGLDGVAAKLGTAINAALDEVQRQSIQAAERISALEQANAELERKLKGQTAPGADSEVEQLRERELRLRTILELIQVGMLVIDARTHSIIEANPTALRMFGAARPEDVVGHVCHRHVCPAEIGRCPITDLGQPVDNTERTLLRADGSRMPILKSVTPFALSGRAYLLECFVDITERKQIEEQLRVAKELAETATRVKSEFLANMSHEIRTPMTAILGYAESLLEGEMREAEHRAACQTILRNGEHLLRVINDILDLSKIEADRMTVECVPVSPCSIVAEVASLMRVRALAKGLEFQVEYHGAVPATIPTDPVRVRQILINLVGNAVKFTVSGSVRLIIHLACEAAGPSLQFEVVDTGVGMDEQQVAHLFQAFTQADASTTRRFGGTGLGLVISRRLAQMLGGDVSIVATQVGCGTHMRVRVPTGPLDGVALIADPLSRNSSVDERRASPRPAALPAGCRILLAEDGPDNQRLIVQFLERAGALVTVAENGELALRATLEAEKRGTAFDLVLMDMQMPVMDGYEAVRQLRARGYRGPVVALTAHAMAGDREGCLAAGCDGFAAKPIDRHKLIEVVRSHLRGPAPGHAGK